jgi:hypothetical protein
MLVNRSLQLTVLLRRRGTGQPDLDPYLAETGTDAVFQAEEPPHVQLAVHIDWDILERDVQLGRPEPIGDHLARQQHGQGGLDGIGGGVGAAGCRRLVDQNLMATDPDAACGGPAPVLYFLPELIELVCNRKIDPDKVFDLTLPLDQVAEGYHTMDERRAIKALLRP